MYEVSKVASSSPFPFSGSAIRSDDSLRSPGRPGSTPGEVQGLAESTSAVGAVDLPSLSLSISNNCIQGGLDEPVRLGGMVRRMACKRRRP